MELDISSSLKKELWGEIGDQLKRNNFCYSFITDCNRIMQEVVSSFINNNYINEQVLAEIESTTKSKLFDFISSKNQYISGIKILDALIESVPDKNDLYELRYNYHGPYATIDDKSLGLLNLNFAKMWRWILINFGLKDNEISDYLDMKIYERSK